VSLTAEQLEDRRAYLGGTDAPALAGVNPPHWSQPIDVYLEKHGLAPERPQSKLMGLGQLMEELVASLATEATGMRWRRLGRAVRSREYPWAGGHLDRVALDYQAHLSVDEVEPGLERALLECKWAQSSRGWGEQGSTEVPLHYAVQVQHYLAVTGRPVAILAVLLGYADFRWYRLERDERLIASLMQLEEAFWRDHVLAGVPPEPDGSEGYGAHLRRSLAQDAGTSAVMTPEQQALARELHQAKAAVAAARREEARLAQALQLSMGDHAELVGPGVRITWRQNRPSRKVRWSEFAMELIRQVRAHSLGEWEPPTTKKAREELVREVAASLELVDEEPGARPFRVEFEDEEEA
jgi:putative phage-type endonuclease